MNAEGFQVIPFLQLSVPKPCASVCAKTLCQILFSVLSARRLSPFPNGHITFARSYVIRIAIKPNRKENLVFNEPCLFHAKGL